MSKQDQAQIYEMLSVLFLTVSKGEQVLQCIRQVITSHPLFSPLPLFRYLCKNGVMIKKEHLTSFLQENKEEASDEEIKCIIQFEAGKKNWQYSDFLEFIYPFNSAVLRQINTHHVKRYQKLQHYNVPEINVAGFLMLLTEQVKLIRKVQTQKGDSLLKISKERLRKVLLTIKKAGNRQPSHCENDNTRITSLQLRNFMKSFISVEESHFLFLSRKLGIKKGSFSLEELERFIKPLKKISNKAATAKHKVITPQKDSQSSEKDFNQNEYRNELQSQLAFTLNGEQKFKKQATPKKIQANTLNGNNNHQTKPKQSNKKEVKINPRNNIINNDNYYTQKQKNDNSHSNSSPKDLLIKFIEVFLPAARKLQDLKIKLAQHKVDYLKLFKLIDRNQRGVASADDIYSYYNKLRGNRKFTSKQFELIIERYAQSDQPWLSFSQFCEMVRAQDKQAASRGPPKLGEQDQQLVLQIFELCIDSQLTILKIRSSFRKHQSKYLFNLINREQNGFINYQELKRFLSEAGLHLSMHDLMIVLKRLDRSRNGVVIQNEFVSYFQPPIEEQY